MVTATAVQAVQEAFLQGSIIPIEAYICDLHILDVVQGSQQVACMTLETGIKPNKKILSWA